MHAIRRLALAGVTLLGSVAPVVTPRVALAQRTSAKAIATARATANANANATTPAISAADLRRRLFAFADDSMNGRATGTDDHLRATAWIAAELARLGLEPAGDRGTYFQDLPLVSRGFVPGGSITVGSQRYLLGADFGATVAREGVVALPPEAQVVYGGEWGMPSTYPPREAIEGRVVLLKPNSRSISFGARTLQVDAASHLSGAAAVVIPAWDQLPSGVRRQLTSRAFMMRENTTQLPPTFAVSAAMFDALLTHAGSMVALEVAFVEAPAPARNVVAVLRGRDAALRGQYVAIGAHSDHEGPLARPVDHDSLRAARRKLDVDSARAAARARGTVRLDSIRNGADDDGSGTVAVLELAEAMASAGERPRRSVLFVWHAGEELGLLGADWFTERATERAAIPRDSIVALVNLDMVGRGGAGDIKHGGPRYLQLIGARRLSPELGDLVDKVNASQPTPFRFDLSYDADGHRENIYCRSDHAKYARYGIPVVFLTTGLHADYHQVTDEPQYVDYDKLEAITTFVRDLTIAVADRTARPKVTKPRPDPTARCRQ